mmetsp:Transcript_26058/g.39408  ORF Transcript_26058/g.39408 Transcript_26058/m.39408 type:complete len:481 (+) Transcript_26058:156-1598(+)
MEDYAPGASNKNADFGNDTIIDDNNSNDEIILDQKSSFCTMRRFKITMAILLLALLMVLLIVIPVAVLSGGEDEEELPLKGTFWTPVGDLQRAKLGDDVKINGMGESLDLSGSGLHLAIGSNQALINKGRVDVLQYHGNRWEQIGKPLSGDVEGENFGHCVRLNRIGSILLVSGFGSDPDGRVGKVQSFTFRDSNNNDKADDSWVQFGGDVTGDGLGDRFGAALSMDQKGTAFIVGADGDEQESLSNGYAKIYEMNEEMQEWKFVRRFDGEFGSRLGNAVAMSGDGKTVCIGERDYRVLGKTSGEHEGTGRVRCWTGTDWLFRKGYELVGDWIGGAFGYSLSLNEDGTVLAVGDRRAGDQKEGGVITYQFRNDKWHKHGERLSGAGNDQGGFQVALNAKGDVLAWTARGYDEEVGDTDVGIVRVAQYAYGEWIQVGNDIAGEDEGDWFGESVALSDSGHMLSASSNKINGEEYVKTYQLS